jgi:hypothetical protein
MMCININKNEFMGMECSAFEILSSNQSNVLMNWKYCASCISTTITY